MKRPEDRNIKESLRYFLDHLKFTYRDNKIIFTRYLFYTLGRVLTYPFRKLDHSYRNKEAKYKQVIKGKKEILLNILGYKMLLPAADEGLTKDLIMDGIREESSVNVLFKEYRKDMNTIDLGANLGYYLLMEARIRGNGNGKIWGIEPNPMTFNYLKKNVKLNNYKNIELMNIAISDKKGKMPFYMSKNWNCSRFDKGPDVSDIIKVKDVKIDSLDNLFAKKKVDFIRMDVEGYEFNILKGATKVIKDNPGIQIYFEFHAQFFNTKQREEFIEFLKKNNLKIKYLFLGEDMNPKPFSKSYKDLRNAPFTTHYLLLERKI